jgi:endonuclease YncB( thermonuclease family)
MNSKSEAQRTWPRVACLLLLFSALSCFAVAYTVVLQNGRRIQGDLLSEDQDSIRIRTSSGIEATFKKSSLDLPAMEKLNRPGAGKQVPSKSGKTYTNEDLEGRYPHPEEKPAQTGLLGGLSSAADDLLDGLVSAVPTPAVPRERVAVRIDSILDGQTLKVRHEPGLVQTIRLIGLRSPQGGNNRQAECYYRESFDYLKQLLPPGSKAVIETDRSNDEDGRILCYVYASNGDLVNLKMVRDGYSRVDESSPFDRMAEFAAAQAKAMRDGVGLWKACGLLPKPTPGESPTDKGEETTR